MTHAFFEWYTDYPFWLNFGPKPYTHTHFVSEKRRYRVSLAHPQNRAINIAAACESAGMELLGTYDFPEPIRFEWISERFLHPTWILEKAGYLDTHAVLMFRTEQDRTLFEIAHPSKAIRINPFEAE